METPVIIWLYAFILSDTMAIGYYSEGICEREKRLLLEEYPQADAHCSIESPETDAVLSNTGM